MQATLYIIFSLVPPTIMAQRYACNIKQGQANVPCLEQPGSSVVLRRYNGGDQISAYCWEDYWKWLQSDATNGRACYVGATEIDFCCKYLKGLSMGSVSN